MASFAAQTCIQFCMEELYSSQERKKTSFRPRCNLPQYLIYFFYPFLSLISLLYKKNIKLFIALQCMYIITSANG